VPQGEWVQVSGDLKPGDQVVIAGASVIAAGTKIQPVAYAGGRP
jgi:multidrug efflux pump subunit AcrA (membrane-fusion protein)